MGVGRGSMMIEGWMGFWQDRERCKDRGWQGGSIVRGEGWVVGKKN